ncbi:MAG TPA: methionyl-tRNA formyltransferase [Candidatus Limnocylindria bacterium]|nr:methionyl-tRNA formyltransferase [Candidatus Limnocylindria bacterium]
MTGRARAVFLGSGGFAIPIVERLAELPGVQLVAVVTAPPRPRGRGAAVHSSPVGEWAAQAGLASLTPSRLRAPEAVAQVAALEPELLVLADYGQLVPAELLELPGHGALNLHPSLLPRHRGAAPIPAAILAGDDETGVSLMLMDTGLDTGPLVAQRRLPLAGDELAPELEGRLGLLAADLLADSLPAWLAGSLEARPQASQGATLTRPLRRENGRLEPGRSATELERQVRAYQPWPGSFLETPHGRLIVWRAAVLPDVGLDAAKREAGELVAPAGDAQRLALVTRDGLLEILEAQPAGGRRLAAAELLRGRPGLPGSRVA